MFYGVVDNSDFSLEKSVLRICWTSGIIFSCSTICSG